MERRKILVVDDEPDVVEHISRRLKREGYDVVSAADGIEGVDAAIRELPNLILMDVLMPNKDGHAALRTLKSDERTRQIPVIMVTARGDTTTLYESQRQGAVDYFIKPFNGDQLVRYIKKYLALTE